jgi:hypothetical protein
LTTDPVRISSAETVREAARLYPQPHVPPPPAAVRTSGMFCKGISCSCGVGGGVPPLLLELFVLLPFHEVTIAH